MRLHEDLWGPIFYRARIVSKFFVGCSKLLRKPEIRQFDVTFFANKHIIWFKILKILFDLPYESNSLNVDDLNLAISASQSSFCLEKYSFLRVRSTLSDSSLLLRSQMVSVITFYDCTILRCSS